MNFNLEPYILCFVTISIYGEQKLTKNTLGPLQVPIDII